MCQCQQVSVLKDAEVRTYREMLKKRGVDSYRWERLFQCEVCKTYWLETYPDPARSDGPVFLTKTIDQEVILRFNEPEHDFSVEL